MDASQIPEASNTIRVAKLLGLDPKELEDALTTKTIFAQGDSVVRYLRLFLKCSAEQVHLVRERCSIIINSLLVDSTIPRSSLLMFRFRLEHVYVIMHKQS